MKIKYYKDRKGLIMRPRENYVGSMQISFQNIMNEIIEHVIEGICFEVHRAVKLDYFPVNEHVVEEQKFEIHKGEKTSSPVVDDDQDIYGNTACIDSKSNKSDMLSSCPFCGQVKSSIALARHVKTCDRINGSSSQDNNGKRENFENNVKDEDNSVGKKGNDAKKQAKSTVNYDTASPEQIHEFLSKHCGVISMYSKKPCSNSANCSVHSKDKKEEVRSFLLGRHAENLLDGDIDIDTVD